MAHTVSIPLDEAQINQAAQAICRTQLQQDSPSGAPAWDADEWVRYWENGLTESIRHCYRERAVAAIVAFLCAPPQPYEWAWEDIAGNRYPCVSEETARLNAWAQVPVMGSVWRRLVADERHDVGWERIDLGWPSNMP